MVVRALGSWENGVSVTSPEDIGRVTARVVFDDEIRDMVVFSAGDTITLSGTGLIQTAAMAVGGVRVNAYTVNSDLQVTFVVPTGAKTGKVGVSTPGGTAISSQTFTVTP